VYRDAAKTVLLVTGMLDNSGRERVAEALDTVRGVIQVDVNLFRARAVIVHAPPCVSTELVRAVAEAGYQAVPEEG
jgi:copper chaperone CopZ